jgi:cytoskeletal protein CcmA (bactofilin family)
MANLGREIKIRGEIHVVDDLTIEGCVEGLVWNEGLAVTVGSLAEVNGDIVARDITVFGQVVGSLIASGTVDVRDTARVSGRVVAPTFVLAEGAVFTGLVQSADATIQTVPNETRAVTAA